MLRRAIANAKKKKSEGRDGGEPSSSSAPPRARCRLNLRESPLMRWAAKAVSKGGQASLFQQVAQAAIEECQAAGASSGASMVTESAPIIHGPQ